MVEGHFLSVKSEESVHQIRGITFSSKMTRCSKKRSGESLTLTLLKDDAQSCTHSSLSGPKKNCSSAMLSGDLVFSAGAFTLLNFVSRRFDAVRPQRDDAVRNDSLEILKGAVEHLFTARFFSLFF